MTAPKKRKAVAGDLMAYIVAHPGCTSTAMATAFPHFGRQTIRSALSRWAILGVVAVRGPLHQHFYFASEEVAEELWAGMPPRLVPPRVRGVPRARGTRIRVMLQSFLCSRPEGSSVRDMAAHFGCSDARAGTVALAEMAAGHAFRCPAAIGFGYMYFGDPEHLNTAQPKFEAQAALCSLQRQQAIRDYQRIRNAARAAGQRAARDGMPAAPKPPKPVKPLKPAPAPQAAKPPAPKRPALERAPDLLPKHAERTAPVKRGPAMLACEPDTSGAKVTRAPTPPGRYEVPADFRGSFSCAGIGRDVETGAAW